MPRLPDPIGPVSFRLFRGDQDFPGMVKVLDVTKEADGVERHDTVEEMKLAYDNLSNCDPATDVLIAEADGQVAGYSRVTWWEEALTGDRRYLQFGWVVPEERRQGVGTTMLRWCEERLREIAAAHPTDCQRIFFSFYEDTEKDRKEILENEGYEAFELYADMTRSLDDEIPEYPLPEGLEIRGVTRDDLRQVFEAHDLAFRDHVGAGAATEEDWSHWQSDPLRRPELWKVAFDGDEIAGQVLNYINEEENAEYGRKRGWTEDISVQRKWRGQGVAKALIAESLHLLRDLGMEQAALGVHVENPMGAFRLYEAMGYEVVKQSTGMKKALG